MVVKLDFYAWNFGKELYYDVQNVINRKDKKLIDSLLRKLATINFDDMCMIKREFQNPYYKDILVKSENDGICLDILGSKIYPDKSQINESLYLSELLKNNEISSLDLLLSAQYQKRLYPFEFSRLMIGTLLYFESFSFMTDALLMLIKYVIIQDRIDHFMESKNLNLDISSINKNVELKNWLTKFSQYIFNGNYFANLLKNFDQRETFFDFDYIFDNIKSTDPSINLIYKQQLYEILNVANDKVFEIMWTICNAGAATMGDMKALINFLRTKSKCTPNQRYILELKNEYQALAFATSINNGISENYDMGTPITTTSNINTVVGVSSSSINFALYFNKFCITQTPNDITYVCIMCLISQLSPLTNMRNVNDMFYILHENVTSSYILESTTTPKSEFSDDKNEITNMLQTKVSNVIEEMGLDAVYDKLTYISPNIINFWWNNKEHNSILELCEYLDLANLTCNNVTSLSTTTSENAAWPINPEIKVLLAFSFAIFLRSLKQNSDAGFIRDTSLVNVMDLDEEDTLDTCIMLHAFTFFKCYLTRNTKFGWMNGAFQLILDDLFANMIIQFPWKIRELKNDSDDSARLLSNAESADLVPFQELPQYYEELLLLLADLYRHENGYDLPNKFWSATTLPNPIKPAVHSHTDFDVRLHKKVQNGAYLCDINLYKFISMLCDANISVYPTQFFPFLKCLISMARHCSTCSHHIFVLLKNAAHHASIISWEHFGTTFTKYYQAFTPKSIASHYGDWQKLQSISPPKTTKFSLPKKSVRFQQQSRDETDAIFDTDHQDKQSMDSDGPAINDFELQGMIIILDLMTAVAQNDLDAKFFFTQSSGSELNTLNSTIESSVAPNSFIDVLLKFLHVTNNHIPLLLKAKIMDYLTALLTFDSIPKLYDGERTLTWEDKRKNLLACSQVTCYVWNELHKHHLLPDNKSRTETSHYFKVILEQYESTVLEIYPLTLAFLRFICAWLRNLTIIIYEFWPNDIPLLCAYMLNIKNLIAQKFDDSPPPQYKGVNESEKFTLENFRPDEFKTTTGSNLNINNPLYAFTQYVCETVLLPLFSRTYKDEVEKNELAGQCLCYLHLLVQFPVKIAKKIRIFSNTKDFNVTMLTNNSLSTPFTLQLAHALVYLFDQLNKGPLTQIIFFLIKQTTQYMFETNPLMTLTRYESLNESTKYYPNSWLIYYVTPHALGMLASISGSNNNGLKDYLSFAKILMKENQQSFGYTQLFQTSMLSNLVQAIIIPHIGLFLKMLEYPSQNWSFSIDQNRSHMLISNSFFQDCIDDIIYRALEIIYTLTVTTNPEYACRFVQTLESLIVQNVSGLSTATSDTIKIKYNILQSFAQYIDAYGYQDNVNRETRSSLFMQCRTNIMVLSLLADIPISLHINNNFMNGSESNLSVNFGEKLNFNMGLSVFAKYLLGLTDLKGIPIDTGTVQPFRSSLDAIYDLIASKPFLFPSFMDLYDNDVVIMKENSPSNTNNITRHISCAEQQFFYGKICYAFIFKLCNGSVYGNDLSINSDHILNRMRVQDCTTLTYNTLVAMCENDTAKDHEDSKNSNDNLLNALAKLMANPSSSPFKCNHYASHILVFCSQLTSITQYLNRLQALDMCNKISDEQNDTATSVLHSTYLNNIYIKMQYLNTFTHFLNYFSIELKRCNDLGLPSYLASYLFCLLMLPFRTRNDGDETRSDTFKPVLWCLFSFTEYECIKGPIIPSNIVLDPAGFTKLVQFIEQNFVTIDEHGNSYTNIEMARLFVETNFENMIDENDFEIDQETQKITDYIVLRNVQTFIRNTQKQYLMSLGKVVCMLTDITEKDSMNMCVVQDALKNICVSAKLNSCWKGISQTLFFCSQKSNLFQTYMDIMELLLNQMLNDNFSPQLSQPISSILLNISTVMSITYISTFLNPLHCLINYMCAKNGGDKKSNITIISSMEKLTEYRPLISQFIQSEYPNYRLFQQYFVKTLPLLCKTIYLENFQSTDVKLNLYGCLQAYLQLAAKHNVKPTSFPSLDNIKYENNDLECIDAFNSLLEEVKTDFYGFTSTLALLLNNDSFFNVIARDTSKSSFGSDLIQISAMNVLALIMELDQFSLVSNNNTDLNSTMNLKSTLHAEICYQAWFERFHRNGYFNILCSPILFYGNGPIKDSKDKTEISTYNLDDVLIQSVCEAASHEAGSNLKILYLYRSILIFLTKIASTKDGALVLLENNIILAMRNMQCFSVGTELELLSKQKATKDNYPNNEEKYKMYITLPTIKFLETLLSSHYHYGLSFVQMSLQICDFWFTHHRSLYTAVEHLNVEFCAQLFKGSNDSTLDTFNVLEHVDAITSLLTYLSTALLACTPEELKMAYRALSNISPLQPVDTILFLNHVYDVMRTVCFNLIFPLDTSKITNHPTLLHLLKIRFNTLLFFSKYGQHNSMLTTIQPLLLRGAKSFDITNMLGFLEQTSDEILQLMKSFNTITDYISNEAKNDIIYKDTEPSPMSSYTFSFTMYQHVFKLHKECMECLMTTIVKSLNELINDTGNKATSQIPTNGVRKLLHNKSTILKLKRILKFYQDPLSLHQSDTTIEKSVNYFKTKYLSNIIFNYETIVSHILNETD